MVITKQIDETHFEVEITPEDYDRPDYVKVMHDYIGFRQCNSLFTKDGSKISGPASECCNVITVDNYVQIPIRSMIEIVMPLLENHNYLQDAHLHNEEERRSYESSLLEKGIITYDGYNREEMYHYYDKQTRRWYSMPLRLYNEIKYGQTNV